MDKQSHLNIYVKLYFWEVGGGGEGVEGEGGGGCCCCYFVVVCCCGGGFFQCPFKNTIVQSQRVTGQSSSTMLGCVSPLR